MKNKIDNKLSNKLEIMHFINNARWDSGDSEIHNYYTPLYYDGIGHLDENQQKEAKLLSHLLTYISNRQISFRLCFKAGSYVYSYLVYRFFREPGTSVDDILSDSFKNNRLTAPNTDQKKEIVFSSRFMPTDIVCIYKTLKTLDRNYKRSFRDFLNKNSSSVKNLAEAFFKLTYQDVGTWSFSLSNSDKTKNNDKILLNDNNSINFKKLDEHIKISKQTFNPYSAKRLWCVLRDFLRGDLFKGDFKDIIGEDYFQKLSLSDLELPGDVWNNNDTFLKCFWEDKLSDQKGHNLPERIRSFYDQYKEQTAFIPEDYDITFEFVPRVCGEKRDFKFCPFNLGDSRNLDLCHGETDKHSRILDLCHGETDKLCPVIKFCSGFNKVCVGLNECPIYKILKNKG